MSRNYKFHNPEVVYFVSFAMVDWIDVFSHSHKFPNAWQKRKHHTRGLGSGKEY